MDQMVRTTHLEMTSPAQSVSYGGEQRLAIRRAEIPCPELNRFFYTAVGSDWWWYDRIGWGRERWLAYAGRVELETWVGYLDGSPMGYFELEEQGDDQVEIVCFGLLPPFIGRGLGSELLAATLERAWEKQPSRVWVHTCTLDHPHALSNYEARGFNIFKSEEEIEELPDRPLRFWPDQTMSP